MKSSAPEYSRDRFLLVQGVTTNDGVTSWRITDPLIAVFPGLLADPASRMVLQTLWKREMNRVNQLSSATALDVFRHIVLSVWQSTSSPLAQRDILKLVGTFGSKTIQAFWLNKSTT